MLLKRIFLLNQFTHGAKQVGKDEQLVSSHLEILKIGSH